MSGGKSLPSRRYRNGYRELEPRGKRQEARGPFAVHFWSPPHQPLAASGGRHWNGPIMSSIVCPSVCVCVLALIVGCLGGKSGRKSGQRKIGPPTMINTYKRTHTYKLFHQLGVIVYPSILSWFSFQVFEFSEALLIGVTGMKLLVQEIFVYFFVFLKYNSLIKRTVSCIHYVVQILLQH